MSKIVSQNISSINDDKISYGGETDREHQSYNEFKQLVKKFNNIST